MTDAYTENWDHGGAAEVAGLHLSDCPFKPGTEEHADWAYAWTRARSDRLRDSGKMHADTMAMKAQVRAHVGGMPEYQRDRVPEILGEAPETVAEAFDRMVGKVRELFVTFTVNAEPIIEAIKEMARHLDGLASPAPIPPTSATTLNCPRHGPQPKGGHCRVCTRQITRSTRSNHR